MTASTGRSRSRARPRAATLEPVGLAGARGGTGRRSGDGTRRPQVGDDNLDHRHAVDRNAAAWACRSRRRRSGCLGRPWGSRCSAIVLHDVLVTGHGRQLDGHDDRVGDRQEVRWLAGLERDDVARRRVRGRPSVPCRRRRPSAPWRRWCTCRSSRVAGDVVLHRDLDGVRATASARSRRRTSRGSCRRGDGPSCSGSWRVDEPEAPRTSRPRAAWRARSTGRGR